MKRPKVALLISFRSLDEFVRQQENYYMHFLNNCPIGMFYRSTAHFKKFSKAYPKIEREMTLATVSAMESVPKKRLPFEDLWKTYKLMSKFVYEGDKNVLCEGKIDEYFLTR